MGIHYFTSEAVSKGHPDKIADQISDAILDSCLKEDPNSRVACETLISHDLLVIAGEITTKTVFNPQDIAYQVIEKVGFNDPTWGYNLAKSQIISTLVKQSPDIALGIDAVEMGAGDQGIMFGYACEETEELMPLPIQSAHKILKELEKARESTFDYLGPDAKSQVTVEYDGLEPKSFASIVVSSQHREDAPLTKLREDITALLQQLFPKYLTSNTRLYINPTGRFVIGGPKADTGMTGRKLMVDTYGSMAHHGGGAFSGKDATKVDRSGAYMARYIAKNIVAAKLAKKCEVQLAYAIGIPKPLMLNIDTFGTETMSKDYLIDKVRKIFPLTPHGIIETLNLRQPIYFKTASGGHFGRNEFTWEKTDKVESLLS